MPNRLRVDVKADVTIRITPEKTGPIEGGGGGEYVPAAGYWVATDGTPGGAGTYDDPWDLWSLDGTNTVPAGGTIWMKPGNYENKGGTTGYDARYTITQVGTSGQPINIKPESILGVKQHVEVDGRFDLHGCAYVYTHDIDFNYTTAIPATEPSGISTGSSPPELNEWGAAGVHAQDSNGCKAINCQVRNRHAGSFFAFAASTNFEIYGCVATNAGWEAPDRFHGHGFYIANDASSGSSKTVRHSLFTCRAAARAGDPSNAANIYGETPTSDNCTVHQNFFAGATFMQNKNNPVNDMVITENIFISYFVTGSSSTDGKGSSAGNATITNVNLTAQDNRWLDHRVRFTNGNWTSLTMTAARNTLYKTNATWYGTQANHSIPSLPFTEDIIVTDVSVSGGTDTYEWWLNEYDDKKAYCVILALNKADDTVSVDPSSFLTSGDTYSIWRYKEDVNIWDTADITGTWTSGNIDITLDDTALRAEGLIWIKS